MIHFASSHNQKKENTNLKTKSNQNFQKNKLYKSPTNKELKKKHSYRLVEGADTGCQGREDKGQLVDWAVPHLCVHKPGGTSREGDRLYNPGFQHREIKHQNLWL